MNNSNTTAGPDSTDLAGLLDRLPHVGRLLEHQLWEASRALSLDRSCRQGRRFAGLMEAGAMIDAVLLLVAVSKPERSVSAISKIDERWFCAIQVKSARTTVRADHIDMAERSPRFSCAVRDDAVDHAGELLDEFRPDRLGGI